MNWIGQLAAAAMTAGVPSAMPDIASLPVAVALVLPRGTILKLMVIDEVSTKVARPGDRFKLRLDAAVLIDGRVAIPVGEMGVGEVVSASESGIAGRSGKLATRILHLDVGGARIPLDGAPVNAGRSGNTQIVIATLGLTPWGLFARGNNAKLKAGEIVSATTTVDFTPPSPAPAAAPSPGL